MSKQQQSLPQPNRWYTEQWWRYPFPNDEKQANELRRALYALDLYPRYDLARNENLGMWEANSRGTLPDIIAELDRTDVIALAKLARLLALVPREPGLLRGRRCGHTGRRG